MCGALARQPESASAARQGSCRKRVSYAGRRVLPERMEDHSTPCVVAAFEGSVVIRGPGALSGAFTPDAAEASGRLLMEAAAEARAHRTAPGSD